MKSLLYQLADSAFPAGAFTHSFGMEGLCKLGHLEGEAQLVGRLTELVWSTALSALPFVAHAHVRDAVESDVACEAFLSSHVANRASRAQGAAFALATDAAFSQRVELPFLHVAPTFGLVMAGLRVTLDDARQLFLFGALRGALSAAVRLGVAGPLRAQALLYELHVELDAALAETQALFAEDAVHIAPLVDVCQGAQDRLYTRLFQS